MTNKDYAIHILPHIKLDYFTDINNKRILALILEHQKKYSRICTYDELEYDIRSELNENISAEVLENFETIKDLKVNIEEDKLVKDTEKHFQNVAIQNVIIKCAEDIQNPKVNKYDHFPSLLKDALGVSFEKTIGMEFLNKDDILARYEMYINRPEKITLGTKLFNYITDGGFERKTLNLYIAPTHVGKTWKLIDDAAHLFLNGYNVLYITLEMSKEKIMQRIETNLFDLPTTQFKHLTFKKYKEKIIETKKKSVKLGKLIVEEYPPDAANINHFFTLIDELELKKKFIPDVILVDYLAIMKPTDKDLQGLYEKNKKIAEQLRRIAVETNTCVISAIQTNRDGFDASDMSLTATSESIGVPFTADFIAAIIRDEILDDQNEAWIKILKNRYRPLVNIKYNIGINIEHQKFFDVGHEEKKEENEMVKSLKGMV